MDNAFTTFAASLAAGTLPLLVACATLLAMLSLRNSHMSDRCREMERRSVKLVAEIREVTVPTKRLALEDELERVRNQKRMFYRRYKRTALSLISVTLSFVLFVMASVVSPRPGSGGFPALAEGAAVFGTLLLSVGLILLITEFLSGHKTLLLNSPDLQHDT
jgi:hypothetical protein